MSKMKHLLRKLHIGSDHHHHQQIDADARPLVDPPTPQPASASASSSASALARAGVVDSAENSVDFNFFEEEFQVQLALAISVSDPDAREDRETAQIKAAKQISLGRSPSETLVDSIALQYWNYNFVNYDEKVMDGFYDVYGITSNSDVQGKIPLLIDLQAISVSDNDEYEVILVNRGIDPALHVLEERVYAISVEHRVLEQGPIISGLIQRIADLVVDRMGGPVSDADEMLKRWTFRGYELRNSLNSIILPLGCLDVGLSRHRALLFKVLADRINLPCMLIKGSYYTGTDEGAVNLIKFDNGSEYIIDLMGAPGTLIPAEVPSDRLQNSGLDRRRSADYAETVKDLCVMLENGIRTVAVSPDLGRVATVGSSNSVETSFSDMKIKGTDKNLDEKNQTERFENDFGKLLPSLRRSHEGLPGSGAKSSDAQKMKVKDVSKYVISAAKNPEFAQKLHAVLLENAESPPPHSVLLEGVASPTPHLFLDMNSHDLREMEILEKIHMLNVENRDRNSPDMSLSSNEQALIPSTGMQSHPTENMVPEQLELGFTVVNSGHSLPSDNTSEGFVLVNCGTNEMTRIDDCGRPVRDTEGEVLDNLEREKQFALRLTETASSDLPVTCSVHDERINPVLGDVSDWETSWEDLQIGERIGIGSYGEVYRADLNSTEVAVKKFMDQDISGDALTQFKSEVEIMLRLRHPNVVLFMGAVTHPPNLSILTEYLPRGSLYKLLHRPNNQLDDKRRVRMALDVARGMNYLHTSHPTIVHRDLKTPNLLVDKNWVVKVSDFGLSRMQHHTFLSSKSIAGTPEWMAPEVLRNEPSNEKSDVYSFGVILWELATLRVPWTGMNSMQVVGAVGFQNRHLEITEEIDPTAAQIIMDCWHPNPQSRPSFGQLISQLRRLQHLQCPALQRNQTHSN
ncbi:probable serine/threonine-protein kinase SIS8 [Actinidia eriantha]|uniref:probable serine/threonine-protein kinase SIS8 n=1 Tax=Actinidia eriantha TaxID=165200 RepID=UPI00258BC3B2|nr:probable serine/threonine-protein kinase SIS8 [Actinidia eriantha]